MAIVADNAGALATRAGLLTVRVRRVPDVELTLAVVRLVALLGDDAPELAPGQPLVCRPGYEVEAAPLG